jgi:hypothetical protein
MYRPREQSIVQSKLLFYPLVGSVWHFMPSLAKYLKSRTSDASRVGIDTEDAPSLGSIVVTLARGRATVTGRGYPTLYTHPDVGQVAKREKLRVPCTLWPLTLMLTCADNAAATVMST